MAGAAYAPLILGSAALGDHLISTYGEVANYWATGVHIACWLMQFVGHGAFEGRAPALLDNLVQALLLAPFFVWMEVLFMFGYRPELKKRLDVQVERELAKVQKEKEQKVLANGNK